MAGKDNQDRNIKRPNTLDGGGGDPPPPNSDGGGAKSGLSIHRPGSNPMASPIDGYIRLSLEMPYNANRKLVISIDEI